MKVLHVVVIALVVASALSMDDEGPHRRRHRRGANGALFSVRPLRFGGTDVVLVPKCDARAYEDSAQHARRCPNAPKPQAKPATTPTKAATPAAAAATAAKAPILQATLKPRGPPLFSGTPAAAAATGQQSAACTAQKGVCQSSSTCTGDVVHGVCPGTSTWACCVPKGSTAADACLKSFNGATLAAKAIQYQTEYLSRHVIYSQPKRQFGYVVSYADCTSFGYSVMDAVGYGCLFNNARYTAGMIPLMRARGGFHQIPRQGDLAMWGGHMGIVVQACPGGLVDMVAMGLSGCKRTNCISVAALQSWGSGGWLGFWTPHAT